MNMMQASTKPLGVEQAWQRLADGLHCHRYVLDVVPYRERLAKESGMSDTRWSPNQRTPGKLLGWQTLTSIPETLPREVLTLVADSPQHYIAVVEPRTSHPLRPLAWTHPVANDLQAFDGSIGKLLSQSDLRYLIDFGLDVIVLGKQPLGVDVPVGCVWFDWSPTIPAAMSAALLLAQLGSQWFDAFWETDKTPASRIAISRQAHETTKLRALGRLATTVAVFMRAIDQFDCRNLDESAIQQLGLPSLDDHKALLAHTVEQASLMPSLNAADFVTTLSGLPQAFHKYTSGLGAGQSAGIFP